MPTSDKSDIVPDCDKAKAAAEFATALRARYTYDAATGDLVRNFGRKLRGKPCSAIAGNGYKVAVFRGRQYGVHRLVWAYHHGALPLGVVDHINRDCLDNRIENLREIDHRRNMQNRRKHVDNACGLKGVSAKNGKWRATIRRNGKPWHIGYFDSAEGAAQAYDETARELFGEYAATNRVLGLLSAVQS